jgi:hypothetical protein
MQAFTRYATVFMLCAVCGAGAASAQSALDALTSKDATGGLRAALSQGIDTAVAQLGAKNGFLNDPKVAIPLPPALAKAERALRLVGMAGEADSLKTTMNHAAEQAVATAKPIFKQALQRMSLQDAKGRNIFGARPVRSSARNSSRSYPGRRRSCISRPPTIDTPARRPASA